MKNKIRELLKPNQTTIVFFKLWFHLQAKQTEICISQNNFQKIIYHIFVAMRQILLNVEEKKIQFFLELVKSLDFVEVNNGGDSKEAIIQNIKQGLEEVKLAKQGKLKTTPAKEFFNEL